MSSNVARAVASFQALRERIWAMLPGILRRRVSPEAVGFCVLSLSTFALDLVLLAVLRTATSLPNAWCVSIAYGVAIAVGFVTNRRANFEAHHGSLSRQVIRHVLVIVANYLIFVLALTLALESLGLPLIVARVGAGLCEAVFIFLGMRWFVFARAIARRRGHEDPAGSLG